MKTDIEIAQSAKMEHILEIAKKINLEESDLEYYGKYKAKIVPEVWDKIKDNKDGKLILVTAINPTPAGEGKTVTTVGLGQALNYIGKKSIIALREPSLGPVMGVKGGAAGGGYSQVLPMEDINLHFTGDMHAITAANNLLSAMIDNHIKQGNELDFDLDRIYFKRALDVNDRALREINIGLGSKVNGVPRKDGFVITVASEIMAILCLSKDLMDLKNRFGNILIGYSRSGSPIFAKDLKAEGAMALLMKDAIKPNLVQTLENTPCIMHGGPFANIAHGCNSVIATKYALKLSDYVVTEAGFGADLGAEKFFDIKCRIANLKPDAVVLVATIKALKYNGGVEKEDLKHKNMLALANGISNLGRHIDNIKKFGLPVVVSINKFETDTEEEISFVKEYCSAKNVEVAVSEVFKNGGQGGIELANKVLNVVDKDITDFKCIYDSNLSIKDKISILSKEIYGAKDVIYTDVAESKINLLKNLDNGYPICVAKTQYSLSDDPKLMGSPKNYSITVRDINISNGAGFIIVYLGDIMTMPGLPKVPAAEKIDIDENGIISGLF